MLRRLSAGMGFLARIACAVALASLAFHLPAEARTRALSTVELVSYTLPDGSLPPLCVTVPDGSGQGKIVKLGSDTLGLVQKHVLPSSGGAWQGARIMLPGVLLPEGAVRTLRHLLYPPGSGPRAPPASA